MSSTAPTCRTMTTQELLMMETIHPALRVWVVKLRKKAPFPLKIVEGMRSQKRQNRLFKLGASKTTNSAHLTGHAVDICPYVDVNDDGKITTEEMFHWPLYHRLGPLGEGIAQQMGIPIQWGGRWKSFPDGAHWQLVESEYPWNTQWFNQAYRHGQYTYQPVPHVKAYR